MAPDAFNKTVDLSHGIRVTWVCLAGNVALAFVKLVLGLLGQSQALIADAVNSTGDFVTNILVLAGLRVANRPRDEDHPYGHGRIESLVALVLGLGLVIVALYILFGSGRSLVERDSTVPGTVALVGAVIAIVAKEALFRYTRNAGNRLQSPSLIASAWDHRADVYASTGVAIGICGSKLGFPLLDPVAAVAVSVLIILTGLRVTRRAVDELMDRALPVDALERMRLAVVGVPGVRRVTSLRGRRMGAGLVVDVGVMIDGLASARDGHRITRLVDAGLKKLYPNIAETMIHVEVDVESSRAELDRFRSRTREILEDHDGLYLEVHNLDFHISPDIQEVHFHLVVPEGTDFEQAHRASQHLEEEIKLEFPRADVVVHLEPASEALRRGGDQKKGKSRGESGETSGD